MDFLPEILRSPLLRALLIVAAIAAAEAAPNANGQTISYANGMPEIQMYSYPAGSSNGSGSVRDRAATFAGFSELVGGVPSFYQGTGSIPSRRGSFLIAANTATSIPLLSDPSRYQIDSVRVSVTLMGTLILPEYGMTIPYDATQDASIDMTTGVDGDPGNPIEMYGVGFQGGYETFGFTAGQSGPEYFRLGHPRWQALQPGDPGYDPDNFETNGAYKYFAVDTQGRDAENSVAGGYSATAVGGTTPQFTPTPFAIGKAHRSNVPLVSGDELASGDVFEFTPNLSDPGVVSYIQQSLAQGNLGFTFSSMHQPDGHTGTVAYPDYYLDDLDVGANPDGAGPVIEIQVTILPDGQAGDFDGDGDVDGSDLLVWQRQLGAMATPPGSGSDADGDGRVTGADLTFWRDNFVAAAPSVNAIPEPTAAALAVILGVACLGMRVTSNRSACRA